MKLDKLLLEQTEGTIPVLRGFGGNVADLARNKKPIPVPPRGVSWWAYGNRHDSLDDIFREYQMDSTYGVNGVVIATRVSYTIQDHWIVFENNWGFGVEHEDSIDDTSYDILTANNIIERIKDPTYGFTELFLPRIPLSTNGKDFWDHTIPVRNGLVCKKPIQKYKIFFDSRTKVVAPA